MLDRILAITNDDRWFDSPCAREIRKLIEDANNTRAQIDTGALSNEIRARARALRNATGVQTKAKFDFESSSANMKAVANAVANGDGALTVGVCDDGELLTVLARIVEGMPIERAFGPPGEWGYEHPIGRALRGVR
jgi:hypothetical protein